MQIKLFLIVGMQVGGLAIFDFLPIE